MPITRPPNCVPGIGVGIEPVAMITPLVASISVPSKLPPILTLPSLVTEAWPSISSILFFLNSPPTPPTSVPMTFWRRSVTLSKSTVRPSTAMPNSPASSISERMSAVRRTALAGMQA